MKKSRVGTQVPKTGFDRRELSAGRADDPGSRLVAPAGEGRGQTARLLAVPGGDLADDDHQVLIKGGKRAQSLLGVARANGSGAQAQRGAVGIARQMLGQPREQVGNGCGIVEPAARRRRTRLAGGPFALDQPAQFVQKRKGLRIERRRGGGDVEAEQRMRLGRWPERPAMGAVITGAGKVAGVVEPVRHGAHSFEVADRADASGRR
jgi:hypothetical protein